MRSFYLFEGMGVFSQVAYSGFAQCNDPLILNVP
jgi:hypothetical protein